MPLKQRLGQQIASLRRKAGRTQEAFAEQTGYSVDFIGLVERGINAPSVEGLERMADALNLEVRDLFDFRQAARQKRR